MIIIAENLAENFLMFELSGRRFNMRKKQVLKAEEEMKNKTEDICNPVVNARGTPLEPSRNLYGNQPECRRHVVGNPKGSNRNLTGKFSRCCRDPFRIFHDSY